MGLLLEYVGVCCGDVIHQEQHQDAPSGVVANATLTAARNIWIPPTALYVVTLNQLRIGWD